MTHTSALLLGLVVWSASAPALAQAPRGAGTAASAASSQNRGAAGKTDEQVLIQLERDWDAAFQRKDSRFLASILADEFVATYGDGTRGDKAKELALADEFNQQVDSRTLNEFTVKVYGDTAVVWFSQQLTGPKQGKPVAVTYRYTDVFVRRGGRWQAVASHSSRVGERAIN
jgi:ketosteroid isomerase-like protein